MAGFKETGRIERTIQAATPAELARQASYNAFAFGGEALGGGPSVAEIANTLRRQGRLRELSPADRAMIERATVGGFARSYAPQLEAAANQLSNILNARGVRGSTGSLLAGLSAPLAAGLGEAQRQQASAELSLPFQIQEAGLRSAGALQGLRGQQGAFAQFSLQRDLSERQSNFIQRTFKKKRGFFSRIGAALGGALLGGFTGGIGTALAGGVTGLFGGGDGGSAPALPISSFEPAFNLSPRTRATRDVAFSIPEPIIGQTNAFGVPQPGGGFQI